MFTSQGTNLVTDGNGRQQDVFLKDMNTGVTSIASISTTGAASVGGWSSRPDISEDGSTIAYSSDATNLVPGDGNGQEDCFVTSRSNLRNVRLTSVGNAGQALDSGSYRCQLSTNGSMMVFASFAGNATATSMSQGQRIYVRNLQANTTTLVSRRPNGTPALASRPDISGSGACATYQSKDAGIVPGDPDATDDVFLFDIASGSTRMMSLDSNGNHVTGASNRIVVNGNCTARGLCVQLEPSGAGRSQQHAGHVHARPDERDDLPPLGELGRAGGPALPAEAHADDDHHDAARHP